MAFPTAISEIALHEQLLSGDPNASRDIFEEFVDPLAAATRADLGTDEDIAHDSAIDAIVTYLGDPTRYDRHQGRLSTYLMRITKRRAIDRLRSATSRKERDQQYAEVVELRARNPKEVMEEQVEVEEHWNNVSQLVPKKADRQALRLILDGERATEELARAFGFSDLPQTEQRREVKRARDRLLKVLRRYGERIENGRA